MSLDEKTFLTIAAGKYGRDLLKRYRKRLAKFPISRNDPLPAPDKLTEYCRKLFRDIIRGNYSPKAPQDYIILNKHHGVPRILPVFAFDDALIYYFCVFSIQEQLAEGVVRGTFGGWQSSNSIRKKEEISAPSKGSDSITYIPYASVNRLAWSRHWMDFQREAYAVSQRGNNPFVVKYDVANFYDSVDLTRLERMLRHRCSSVYADSIGLLMSFLRGWNRRMEGWTAKQAGLPMDVEGEASRLLANFYLQEHDAALSKYVHEDLGGEYLRYSDDMLILVSSEDARYRGLVKSGIELHRAGLSVNSGKVISFDNFQDYDFYWAFELFDLIGDGQDAWSVNVAADQFFGLIGEERETRPWRQDSVLRRLLSVGANTLNERNRRRLTSEATRKEILATMSDYHLRKIYDLLPKEERSAFIDRLNEDAEVSAYSQQLLHLRAFFSNLSPPEKISHVNRRLKELAAFYGFHVD